MAQIKNADGNLEITETRVITKETLKEQLAQELRDVERLQAHADRTKAQIDLISK